MGGLSLVEGGSSHLKSAGGSFGALRRRGTIDTTIELPFLLIIQKTIQMWGQFVILPALTTTFQRYGLMAKNEAKVMEFVKKELKKNPDASTTDLYAKAKGVDSGIADLTLRQFNARFPLQVKRQQSLSQGGGRRRGASRRTRRTAQNRRDAVRETFLRFAADLSAADERKDLVRVLAQVDGYVDDAMKAAGR